MIASPEDAFFVDLRNKDKPEMFCTITNYKI